MQKPLEITVVDSDPHSTQRVLKATQDYISEVVAYSSLKLMVEALPDNSPIDTIIFNLERPFEAAFDVLPSLKSKFPGVEIVFVTRFDDETMWVEAIQRGAYDLLPKPIDPSELSRIIRLAVEKHRATKTLKRSLANPLRVNKAKAAIRHSKSSSMSG